MKWPATGFHWLDTSSRNWLREMTGLGPASQSSLPVYNSFISLTFCLSSSILLVNTSLFSFLLWSQAEFLFIRSSVCFLHCIFLGNFFCYVNPQKLNTCTIPRTKDLYICVHNIESWPFFLKLGITTDFPNVMYISVSVPFVPRYERQRKRTDIVNCTRNSKIWCVIRILVFTLANWLCRFVL